MKCRVIVHPNSKHPRVEKDLLGDLHAYVSAPPLEGRANTATIEALAQYYQIAKSNITLLQGQKSKLKTFEIFD
jgi:uncharacterized protein YggU (UPF0235/DUF167 family)